MHEIIEKIKKAFNKFWYGSEVKKVRVTVRDLEKNTVRIQEAIDKVQDEIDEISKEIKNYEPCLCDRDVEKCKKLKEELKEKHELYSTLQKEMEQEYNNIKKQKDGRFIMSPKDGLIIGGLIFVGTFMVALERENPKAIKMCQFLLKLFPLHI